MPDGPTNARLRGPVSVRGRRVTDYLERAQDLVTFLVGGALIILATVLLVAAVVDLATQSRHSVGTASTDFLDRTLLVLIIVELVHTVVLSLRTHTLQAEPFVVVGLIAVIRKILLVLAGASTVSSTTLSVLAALLLVFIVGLIGVRLTGSARDRDSDSG